jgi:hypothetical protein
MSHSRGKLHLAKFCPWCGTEAPVRDHFEGAPNQRVEFVCLSCGVGYRLLESTRRNAAANLFRQQRKIRQPESARVIFSALCAQKIKELKRHHWEIARERIAEEMVAWLKTQGVEKEWTPKKEAT